MSLSDLTLRIQSPICVDLRHPAYEWLRRGKLRFQLVSCRLTADVRMILAFPPINDRPHSSQSGSISASQLLESDKINKIVRIWRAERARACGPQNQVNPVNPV